ncbi:MAG TPA: iron-sulfur protein, partial [Candidatus Lokiarchaeia archaeon]
CFSEPIEVINLYDIDIKGGCLSCIRCGYDNQCAYDKKDDFRDFWNNKMINADVLIFAGTIKDRYLSSRWKMVFDRSFFNGHIPTIIGKQIGFLISGPISQIANLKQIFTAYVELQESNLVDIVSDEFGDSKDIDLLLYDFAEKSIRFSNLTYKTPPTFLAIGGVKIFRDNVYESLRSIFQADHRYYKKYGYYDFPKKTFGSRLLKFMFKMKGFRRSMYKNNRMQHEMIKPLKKLVQKA